MSRQIAKTAQNVIETTLVSQSVKRPVLPETHPEYDQLKESPGIFKKNPPPTTGNLAKLKSGMAQALRVNNPYRQLNNDEMGRAQIAPHEVGFYKANEIGSDSYKDAGKNWALFYEGKEHHNEGQRKLAARVMYSMPSKMHRVPTGHSYQTRGGPWTIQIEESNTFKKIIDGFNQSRSLPQWQIRGFEKPEDAVRYAASFGWSIEVEVPRFRYTRRKSYADNFKYKPLKEED